MPSEVYLEWIKKKIKEAGEKQLKGLNLRGDYFFNMKKNLTQIPDEVFELEHLEVLDLSDNQLTIAPESIAKLQRLKSLDLSNNKLTTVPESIAKLQKLKSLDLSANQLTTVPESIANLQELTCLDLSENQLTTVPESISKLQNLTYLNLSSNRLTTVPESIANLQKLMKLYLNHNQLTTVPESIANLQNLMSLGLSDNQLTTVPKAIVKLQKLEILGVESNPIETPPPEVLKKGVNAIKNYFRQMQTKGKDYLYEAKLLIVGEGGAGKTTLAKKIEDKDYVLNENEPTTEGIDVIKWEFPLPENKNFRVNIWDFGGQEIYHATHQFFLTKRSLYTLVADTRKEDTDFYYWLNVVELLSDNSPLLIIKNEKQDRKRQINERQLHGQFINLKETLAANLATNRGLSEILKAIKSYIGNLPHVGTELPKTWVNVRKTLENDTRNHISLDEYLSICQENGFDRLEDKLQLSGYLHDLGVCLHFQDDPLLKKTVILKPTWGTDAVYKVLDNPGIIDNLGKFNRGDLAKIWNEEKYADMHDELLQLMINFKLCYKLKNSGYYIAPQLLTANAPEYTWDYKHNLIMCYKYEFMPKGILSRFIVETHEYIAGQKYVWRSGVILQKEDANAEVIEYYDKREIVIRVSGQNKKELMTIVTYELDKINQTFKRIKLDKLIPCNCSQCKGSKEPHFYRLEKLKKRLHDKQFQVQCDESYKYVEVLRLVDDFLEKELYIGEGEDSVHSYADSREKRDTEPLKEIYISYSWGGESEEIANRLDEAFREKGITIIRDRRDLVFKGRIKEFMERIGRGKCVIVVISNKYLESQNCMFELMQIAKSGDFYGRIFPVVLDDAKIYEPEERISYVQYWEKKKKALDEKMKSVSAEYMDGFREDIDLYADIRKYLPRLTDILRDMNTLTVEIHSGTGFEELVQAAAAKLEE